MVAITNGVPGTEVPVAGAGLLRGIACVSSITCYAVGSSVGVGTPVTDIPIQAIDVPVVNGDPSAPIDVPQAGDLEGIACTSSHGCDAVGRGGDVVSLVGGAPVASAHVPALLDGVACPSSSACEASGLDPSTDNGSVVDITST
jgi:hypothetical protein